MLEDEMAPLRNMKAGRDFVLDEIAISLTLLRKMLTDFSSELLFKEEEYVMTSTIVSKF